MLGSGQADMIFRPLFNERAHLVLRKGLEAGKPSINVYTMLICARKRLRLRGPVSLRPIYLLNLLPKEVAKVIGKLVRVARRERNIFSITQQGLSSLE